MAIKPKTVVTMRLGGECVSHSRTDVSVRDRRLVIDEPEERGGTNQGPAPTETMLGALVGCSNVITHKIAAKMGLDIAALEIDVEARFDRRGVTLAEEIAVPFPDLKLTMRVTTDASDEEIEALKRDLARFCPVSKVLREAGTRIEEAWVVERP